MTRSNPSVLRRACAPALLAAFLLAPAAHLRAQAQNPTSATNPFFGSVTARPATEETLKLSLDEAIGMGLRNNLGLKEAENAEKALNGQKNVALQSFLPNLIVSGSNGIYQHDLAAMGFGPGTLKKFASIMGGSMPSNFKFITRDDLTQGEVQFGQMLFSGPVIAAYKGARAAEQAAHFARMSARGEVVQQVATAYLHALAAQSEIDNALAQLATDQLTLDNARAAHEAGTGAHLDELRAAVQVQAQQLALIAARNDLEKDLILLKREIGVAPGQPIVLTDPAPYSELAAQTPEELRAVAYRNRQDYQTLINQAIEYKAIHSAYRAERLPSLSFGGYYAVSAVNGAGAHGNFVCQGNLSLPLFREARLRGDIQASQAQLEAVQAQLADLRGKIDQQVRSALLDANATEKLVQVARSNVELATRALADEQERVSAGVDDNLPLVAAQSTLASAQTSLVESLFQYNLAKLALARAAGIIETQYREYLGR
ncbi:MAG: TolC family protein [Terracidiphilus sp.]